MVSDDVKEGIEKSNTMYGGFNMDAKRTSIDGVYNEVINLR